MENNKFLILRYTLHGDNIPSFMGRVVLDPCDPNARFIPQGFETQTIIPDIAQKPMIYHNHASIINGATNTTIAAKLTSYLDIHGSSTGQDSVSMKSRVVHRYQMKQKGPAFETLLKSPTPFATQLRQILDEGKYGKCYMVVGFLTAKDATWKTSAKNTTSIEAAGRVPIGELTGTSATVDVEARVGTANTQDLTSSTQLAGTEIFAVAYNEIKKKFTFDKSSSFLYRTEPILGREKRWKAGHFAMGSQEEDSEEEIEYNAEEQPASCNKAEQEDDLELKVDADWADEENMITLPAFPSIVEDSCSAAQ